MCACATNGGQSEAQPLLQTVIPVFSSCLDLLRLYWLFLIIHHLLCGFHSKGLPCHQNFCLDTLSPALQRVEPMSFKTCSNWKLLALLYVGSALLGIVNPLKCVPQFRGGSDTFNLTPWTRGRGKNQKVLSNAFQPFLPTTAKSTAVA